MGVGHRAATVACEALRQVDDRGLGDAAVRGILGQAVLVGGLAQQHHAALDPHGRSVGKRDVAVDEELGCHGINAPRQLAVGHHHGYVGVAVRLGEAQVAGAQEAAATRVVLGGDHQVAGVGVGRLAGGVRGGLAGQLEERLGVALVVEQPLDHGHGQGAVGARADRHPAIVVGGVGGRGVEARIHHHVLQAALGARLGDQPPLALEGVAGLAGGGAHVEDEVGVLDVRLGVGVLGQVIHYRAGAHAIGQAAVGAVVAVVAGAEGVEGEALEQRRAAVVGGLHHHQLVGLRAVLGVLRVDGGVEVVDGAQAVHLALAEQVAALADLLDDLLEGHLLPLTAAAPADPLEAVGDAEGAVDLRHHGVAAGAGGGAVVLALIAEGADAAQRLDHRGAHRQVLVGGERVVGVAGHAQHLVGGVVDAHPHAALGGAAVADGEGHALVRVEGQLAALGVDAVLRRQGVAVDAVVRLLAGAAGDALGHLDQRVGVAGGEGGGTAGGGGALEEAAT